MLEVFAQRLKHQVDNHLWRTHRVRQSAQDSTVQYGKDTLINFNNNDYLGLSNHPLVKEAFIKAAEKYGVGSGSANTISGYTQAHEDLASTLATWLKRDKVLLFSSGYIANIAVLTTLISKEDGIFADKLNHASLNDGMLFSGAGFKRYHHNDVNHLSNVLMKSTQKQKWIITEGIFSMEGDSANLLGLVDLAKRHNAQMILDDVHGLGVFGEHGAGSAEVHCLTQDDVAILIGGFGKSFGTQGAFVAGPAILMDAIMQFARPYLFTTSIAPAIAAATQQSIQIIQNDKPRRERLHQLIKYFREQATHIHLKLLPSHSPIQPILFDSIEQVQQASEALYQEGILVSSMRYPTVPKDEPRLRVSINANHTEKDIDQLISTLKKINDATSNHC